jgi:hypothetical protein
MRTLLPYDGIHLSHGERSDREAIRVRGYALLIELFPLTPTLSPKGRGSGESLPQGRRSGEVLP